MNLRVTFRLLGVAVVAALLSASACREERSDATPTPSGAPAGTGAASDAVDAKAAAPGDAGGASTAATGGGCSQDTDCGLTRIDAQSCCDGCEEWAAPRSEITALEDRCREQNEKCPARACAPGRRMVTAVCREGRCEVSRGGR